MLRIFASVVLVVFMTFSSLFSLIPISGFRSKDVVAAPLNRHAANSLDDYLTSIPKFAMIPAASPSVSKPGAPQDFGLVNRRRKICQTDGYSQTTMFEEIAALDPNSATIYPGALVQGKELRSGRFSPIALGRAGTTLTVTSLPVSGPDIDLSTTVAKPTLATVQKALNKIVGDPKNLAKESLARMNLQISKVNSFEQAMLDTGVSANWLGGSFSARLENVTKSKKNSFIVRFNQVYYEVNASPLPSPSSAFASGVTLDSVRKIAYAGNASAGLPLNPPMLVRTVKYGRMIILAASSDEESSTLELALRASFNGVAADGKYKLDAAHQKVLEKSTFDGIVLGGSATEGAKLLSDIGAGNISALGPYLEKGAKYDPQTSPGAAISYVLTYLDNDVADSSFSADFSLTGCEERPVPIQEVRIGYLLGTDNKDQEMYPYMIIRDRNGRIVVNSGTAGREWASITFTLPNGKVIKGHAAWKENTPHGPFSIGPASAWSLHECDGATAEIGQLSSNGEEPEWGTTAYIDVRIDSTWYTIRGPSTNRDEFRWGDGKPNSTVVGLSCPSI